MTFDEVLEQVRELLQSKGRVAYRALKRRFEFDDEYLEDLKAELIDAEQVARDEDGKVLVWQGSTGEGEKAKRANGEREAEPQSFQTLNQTTGDWHRDTLADRSRVVTPLLQPTRSFCAQNNDSGALSSRASPDALCRPPRPVWVFVGPPHSPALRSTAEPV